MSPRDKPKLLKIASLQVLKDGESKKFEVRRKDRITEAFLIRSKGNHYAYLNLCRHWTVGLDFDDNEFFSEDKNWLVCKNHGAVYQPVTGECVSGPCGGASLYRVPLVEKKGFLYADLEKIDWGDA
jgi:nitrite reductase/ring-hydroxylating ferredoxin subunit